MRIFGVIPFIKYKATLKQQLNGEKDEKWDGELNHVSAFVLSVAWKNDVFHRLTVV